MKKVAFMLLSVAIAIFSQPVEAFYDSSPQCYRVLIFNFFDPVIVQQALSIQDIPQNTWPLIANQLIERVKDVPYRINQQAYRMRPNPLKKPFNVESARNLLENALFEVLSEVLNEYSIQNTFRIHQVYNYIKARHDLAWSECFGAQTKKQ